MITHRLEERYQGILDRIASTARAAGRSPEAVRLVVVTKGHPVETLQAVIAAGARRLGENYVEEAAPKIEALRKPPGLEWHMIGHVQSRKAEPVCRLFDCMHSLDRLKLATRLDRFAQEANRVFPVLLECNVSGEESKAGWPAWNENTWPALAAEMASLGELQHLHICGLMTMAPFLDEPEQARPYFARLRRLKDFLGERLGWDLPELSMGMSGDFEGAIQEGATLVRIGTAILGPRPGY